jgi:hypothetical protein
MAVPNSRIDIRISNPEKDVWSTVADAHGLTLTQLIKQSVRLTVQTYTNNVSVTGGNTTFTTSSGFYPPLGTLASPTSNEFYRPPHAVPPPDDAA